MANEARVRLRGQFPANSRIELHERNGDWFQPGQLGSPVKTATSDKNSVVEFKGLNAGDRFWAVDPKANSGQGRAVAVTAKEQPAAKPKSSPLQSAARGGADPTANVRLVTGARSSKDKKPAPTFFHESVGEPTPKSEQEAEPLPAPRQEDFTGVPQRSDTVSGEAHPKPKDEDVPTVKQEDVPKSTRQRSSTETGEATVIDPKELDVTPSVPQDAQRGRQRSATPEGEATPKPKKATKAQAKSARTKKKQVNPSASRRSPQNPASSGKDVEAKAQKGAVTKSKPKTTSKKRS